MPARVPRIRIPPHPAGGLRSPPRDAAHYLIVYVYGSPASSSPENWPDGGTSAAKSSTYSVPLTVVPDAPDGVIVTSMTAV